MDVHRSTNQATESLIPSCNFNLGLLNTTADLRGDIFTKDSHKSVLTNIVDFGCTKLHVHKDFEELYKHVPKEILPAEYGGHGGTFQEINEAWIKKVEEWGGWLDEDLKYGTDESKRPGKPNTAEDMFGVDGSLQCGRSLRAFVDNFTSSPGFEVRFATARAGDNSHLPPGVT